MTRFNVYLNSGKCIKIEGDDYSLDYNKRSVKFERSNLNIATFNFDNIQGFVMSKEKPEAHGRLIDADVLLKTLERELIVSKDVGQALNVFEIVKAAPTIIEREGITE